MVPNSSRLIQCLELHISMSSTTLCCLMLSSMIIHNRFLPEINTSNQSMLYFMVVILRETRIIQMGVIWRKIAMLNRLTPQNPTIGSIFGSFDRMCMRVWMCMCNCRCTCIWVLMNILYAWGMCECVVLIPRARALLLLRNNHHSLSNLDRTHSPV